MKFDHIVIHVDSDPNELQALEDSASRLGYPFDPFSGKKNRDFCSANINIGEEYLEVVHLARAGVKTWQPQWTSQYDSGHRGAYCIFLEVEDVERTAVALKKSSFAARGPAVITYPGLLGLLPKKSPFTIYYLSNFPGAALQLALMQYDSPEARVRFQKSLNPNAQENDILGIRLVDIALPDLSGSLPLLQAVFPGLEKEEDAQVCRIEKTRFAFRQSSDADSHLRLQTVTSRRANIGGSFKIENVEVLTAGG